MHCCCLRAVKLKVMAMPVINLWLSCSMFHEGYNGLGIVQIVGVTTKMTNDPPVTNQQCHLQCHSNDWVRSNGSRCLIYLHNDAWIDGAVRWAHWSCQTSRMTVRTPCCRIHVDRLRSSLCILFITPTLTGLDTPSVSYPAEFAFSHFIPSFSPTRTDLWDRSVPIHQYARLKRVGNVSAELIGH